PVTPRCDDLEVRRERGIRQLEAHLVVALARAPVRERVSTRLQRDLRLAACDDRTRHGRAEQVLARVDRTGAQRRPYRFTHKRIAQVLDDERARTLCTRTRLQTCQLLALAHVRRDAD